MPRIAYESWSPNAETVSVIRQANAICAEYQAQGYDLTLRQLYYQFVARALIPNTDRSYKRLGSIVNKARMAGMLDWDYIVDRTRNLTTLPHFNSPADVIEAARRSYRRDRWKTQPTRIEVWVEKEALAGVIEQVANRHDVAFFSCRGYVSQSEVWGAARRIGAYIEGGQNVVVLHLGDHDPSGIDMTRDMRERIDTFITQDWINAHGPAMVEAGLARIEDGKRIASLGNILDHMRQRVGGREPFEMRRIALNWDQVEEFNPPPNPTKMTDSRSAGYLEIHGDESWELDALDPATLDTLIEEAVLAARDDAAWDEIESTEAEERALISDTVAHWEGIAEMLRRRRGR
jgi:hypothetical protein